jgi:hypothetical protein
MAQVRGNALVSGINDLKKRYGEDGYKKILEAMKPEHAAVFRNGLIRNNWYPFEAYIDFCEVGDRLNGKGDYTHARITAGKAAEADLSLFLKVVVMVFSTPSELVQKIPAIWGKFYDSGQVVVTADTPTRIALELREFPTPHPLHCELIAGWLEKFLQLTVARKGMKARCAHPQCRTKGARVCEFVIQFS